MDLKILQTSRKILSSLLIFSILFTNTAFAMRRGSWTGEDQKPKTTTLSLRPTLSSDHLPNLTSKPIVKGLLPHDDEEQEGSEHEKEESETDTASPHKTSSSGSRSRSHSSEEGGGHSPVNNSPKTDESSPQSLTSSPQSPLSSPRRRGSSPDNKNSVGDLPVKEDAKDVLDSGLRQNDNEVGGVLAPSNVLLAQARIQPTGSKDSGEEDREKGSQSSSSGEFSLPSLVRQPTVFLPQKKEGSDEEQEEKSSPHNQGLIIAASVEGDEGGSFPPNHGSWRDLAPENVRALQLLPRSSRTDDLIHSGSEEVGGDPGGTWRVVSPGLRLSPSPREDNREGSGQEKPKSGLFQKLTTLLSSKGGKTSSLFGRESDDEEESDWKETDSLLVKTHAPPSRALVPVRGYQSGLLFEDIEEVVFPNQGGDGGDTRLMIEVFDEDSHQPPLSGSLNFGDDRVVDLVPVRMVFLPPELDISDYGKKKPTCWDCLKKGLRKVPLIQCCVPADKEDPRTPQQKLADDTREFLLFIDKRLIRGIPNWKQVLGACFGVAVGGVASYGTMRFLHMNIDDLLSYYKAIYVGIDRWSLPLAAVLSVFFGFDAAVRNGKLAIDSYAESPDSIAMKMKGKQLWELRRGKISTYAGGAIAGLVPVYYLYATSTSQIFFVGFSGLWLNSILDNSWRLVSHKEKILHKKHQEMTLRDHYSEAQRQQLKGVLSTLKKAKRKLNSDPQEKIDQFYESLFIISPSKEEQGRPINWSFVRVLHFFLNLAKLAEEKEVQSSSSEDMRSDEEEDQSLVPVRNKETHSVPWREKWGKRLSIALPVAGSLALFLGLRYAIHDVFFMLSWQAPECSINELFTTPSWGCFGAEIAADALGAVGLVAVSKVQHISIKSHIEEFPGNDKKIPQVRTVKKARHIWQGWNYVIGALLSEPDFLLWISAMNVMGPAKYVLAAPALVAEDINTADSFNESANDFLTAFHRLLSYKHATKTYKRDKLIELTRYLSRLFKSPLNPIFFQYCMNVLSAMNHVFNTGEESLPEPLRNILGEETLIQLRKLSKRHGVDLVPVDEEGLPLMRGGRTPLSINQFVMMGDLASGNEEDE